MTRQAGRIGSLAGPDPKTLAMLLPEDPPLGAAPVTGKG